MPTKKEVHFKITRPRLQVAQVQAAAQDAWAEMRTPGTKAHANAVAHGLKPESLPSKLNQVLVLRSEAAGVGTVDLAVVAIGLASKAAWDLWQYVVLPHIRERWGDKALEERKKAAAKSEAALTKKTAAPKRSKAAVENKTAKPAKKTSKQTRR